MEWVLEQLAGFIAMTFILRNDTYELSYGIFEKFRIKGYAKETIEAAVKYLLARRDNRFITATVRVDNQPSAKALESAGFVRVELAEQRMGMFYYIYPVKREN